VRNTYRGSKAILPSSVEKGLKQAGLHSLPLRSHLLGLPDVLLLLECSLWAALPLVGRLECLR